MERYEAYKDSGVEWLGEIPVGWEVVKLSNGFQQIGSGATPTAGEQKYYFKGKLPWIVTGDLRDSEIAKPTRFITNEAVDDFSALKLFPVNTLLIAMYGATIGKVGLLKFPAYTNQACCALSDPNLFNERYAFYWFLGFRDLILSYSYGGGQPNISQDLIRSLRLHRPPQDEQTAIANFLDRKTAEIDALIAQKEHLLELYEEEKTAIINHAVTKGLEPNAELKDSGVEWLGEIPDGWDIVPLKRVCDVVLGKMLCSEDKGGYHEKAYLRAKNVMWLKVDQDDIKKMWFSSNELNQYRLEAGDLLVSEGGEVGRTCIWNNEISECYIQNSVHRVRFRTDKNSRYYLYLFYCLGKIGVFDAIVNRISIAHLTKEKLQQVLILNPGYNQQTAIANFLDRKMTEIDAKITKTQRIIELQKEYRTALISEVVTGKIKVPELLIQHASA